MKEKKYKAGRVEISSAEYRDLVTEAVEARRDASEIRSEKWNLESENRKLKEELDLTRKRVAELENICDTLRTTPPYSLNTLQRSDTTIPTPWDKFTYGSNNKEGN